MKKALLNVLEALSLKDEVVEKYYQYRSKKFYSKIISQGDLIFDVGANIGNRSETFLKLGARVVAFEPQVRCVEKLKSRFRNQPNILIEKLGLADCDGEIKLAVSSDSSVIATMSDKWIKEGRFSRNNEWDDYEIVNVTTLDQMISKHGLPKFCKIDVEGFELNVLKGLSQPIEYISLEFTKEFFNDAVACIEHVRRLGEVEINFSIGETMKFQNDAFSDVDTCLRQINGINDETLWGDIYIKTKK